jgi:hypothetical protein
MYFRGVMENMARPDCNEKRLQQEFAKIAEGSDNSGPFKFPLCGFGVLLLEAHRFSPFIDRFRTVYPPFIDRFSPFLPFSENRL